MALQKVDPSGKKGIHISFDIDALDTLEVPSTVFPGKLKKIIKNKKIWLYFKYYNFSSWWAITTGRFIHN